MVVESISYLQGRHINVVLPTVCKNLKIILEMIWILAVVVYLMILLTSDAVIVILYMIHEVRRAVTQLLSMITITHVAVQLQMLLVQT